MLGDCVRGMVPRGGGEFVEIPLASWDASAIKTVSTE